VRHTPGPTSFAACGSFARTPTSIAPRIVGSLLPAMASVDAKSELAAQEPKIEGRPANQSAGLLQTVPLVTVGANGLPCCRADWASISYSPRRLALDLPRLEPIQYVCLCPCQMLRHTECRKVRTGGGGEGVGRDAQLALAVSAIDERLARTRRLLGLPLHGGELKERLGDGFERCGASLRASGHRRTVARPSTSEGWMDAATLPGKR
jgi:hypothetical protein